MCSSLSQSISVNSKHALHTNKKSGMTTATVENSQLAPIPDADILPLYDDDDDNEDDEEDKIDDEYTNSNEFGSSGSSDIIGNPEGEDLDKFQNSGMPFFLKEPENNYIVKKKPAVLTCQTMHAFKVSSTYIITK